MALCQWLSTSPLPGVLFVFHRLQLVHPHRDGSVLWKQCVLWMQTALGSKPPSAKRRLLHLPLPVIWSWNKITRKGHCVWPLSDKCPWLWPPLYCYVCFLPFSDVKGGGTPCASPEGRSQSYSSQWGFWISPLPLLPLLRAPPILTSPYHLFIPFSTNLYLQEALHSWNRAPSTKKFLECLVWIALSPDWWYTPAYCFLLIFL